MTFLRLFQLGLWSDIQIYAFAVRHILRGNNRAAGICFLIAYILNRKIIRPAFQGFFIAVKGADNKMLRRKWTSVVCFIFLQG